ncbi:MAG: Hpt domain-containing protein [Patescibacteria group bacterium]|nr:Hpt domain-containing protein [Patescibacteria group bacterium]
MSHASNAAEPIYSSLGADPDLGEIVELFVEEMPGRVQTLVDEYNSCDWNGLRRTAHQLKGAAGSYGFDAISPAAGRLERSLASDEPEEQIRRAVEELVDMCGRARAGSPLN